MRGAARGLIARVAVGLALGLAAAPGAADPVRAVRDLDGEQFLEDEPIWLFDGDAALPAGSEGFLDLPFRLVGRDAGGETVLRLQGDGKGTTVPSRRAGELSASFLARPRPDLHPLGPGPMGGLRAGNYEVRPARGDTTRVLARFRVLEPRGSELAVRAAIARAARLADTAAAGPAGRAGVDRAALARSARLCEAVLARYPRTSYRTAIYAMLWRVREASSYRDEPGRWLEEVFAHFHNTAFGVWALDRYMGDVPPEEARLRLRKLVGLYPDTRVSRAAARWL